MTSFIKYFEQAGGMVENLRISIAGEDLQITNSARSLSERQFSDVIKRSITKEAIENTDLVKTKDPSGAIIEIEFNNNDRRIKLSAVAESPTKVTPVDSAEVDGYEKIIKRRGSMPINKLADWVVEAIKEL